MSSTNRIRKGQFQVRIETTETVLDGELSLSDRSRGLVIFAHGRGDGTASATDRVIAQALSDWNIGSLRVDLLTPGERAADERTGEYRSDRELLSRRLVETAQWAREQQNTRSLALAFLGTGTGAAAAMLAVTDVYMDVRAIACRNGNLDLNRRALGQLRTPTMLVVGELDRALVHVNRSAMSHIPAPCDMVVVPGVMRRTKDPDSLDIISTVLRGFFAEHLQHRSARPEQPQHSAISFAE